MRSITLLSLLFVVFSCTDIYEEFPVPPASTVPQFSYVIDEVNRVVVFENESIIPESAGTATYTWSFGDGSTSSEASPTHTYNNYGEYQIKLVVITSESKEIKETATTLALLQPIDIDFTLFYMDTDFTTIRGVGQSPVDIELGTFGSGLAINAAEEKLYFVDDDNFEIKRVNLDGTELETLYSGLTGANAITLDLENQQIFWTNRADGTVHRGKTDGSGSAETIINSLSLPEGIAYYNGKIYISDVDVPPVGENIYVANANGSALEVFVPGSWGYGLGIDPINERLYYGDQGVYDDAGDNHLRSVNLNDNTDIQVIAELEPLGANGSRTYGIAIAPDEGKVYWSDRGARKIKRASFDGAELETLLVSEGTPRGIAIFK